MAKKYCKCAKCYGWKDYLCLKCNGWIRFVGFDPSKDSHPKEGLNTKDICLSCEKPLKRESGYDSFNYCANKICARYKLLVSYND